MPVTRKWPISELLKAVRYYLEQQKYPVTFEYVLLKDVNDSLKDAERLKKLVDGLMCKVNLIPYNEAVSTYKRPSQKQIMVFYEKMADLKSPVTIRWSKGQDIDAACGQLAVNETA